MQAQMDFQEIAEAVFRFKAGGTLTGLIFGLIATAYTQALDDLTKERVHELTQDGPVRVPQWLRPLIRVDEYEIEEFNVEKWMRDDREIPMEGYNDPGL